jgi:L-ribulose-5-phosphate 3-epimerase
MTPQTPAQLGICSWSMRPESPQQMADVLQELGLSRLQLGLVAHRDAAGIVDGMPQALQAIDATIVSGMFGTVGEDYSSLETIKVTGGVAPDEHWEQNQQVAKAAAAKAKEFGLSMVMFHAGFLPHDENDPQYKKLAGRIAEIAGLFNQQGIDLLFETGQETANDLWAFLQYMDRIGVTNIGVNFDPANMILYDKGDPIEALTRLLPRVKSIHIKDAIRTKTPGTWGQEVPVGDGEVNWFEFIKVLAQGDYTGDLNIEREAGEDRITDAKKAIERLTQVMADVQ